MIESCNQIVVGDYGTARVVVNDVANDLSVLKVQSGPSQFAHFRGDKKIRLGEAIIVYGFPYAGILSQDGNLTQGNISAMYGLEDDSRMYQITAPVQPGNSGGALLDSSKSIVGVVTAKLNALAIATVTGDIPQNVNFALKGNILESVLEINGIDFMKSESSIKYELVM